MLHLRINPQTFSDGELLPAVEALKSGRIVAFPTDTLYGLGVNPRSKSAVGKLFGAKQRDRSRPVPLIAPDIEVARSQVGTFSTLAETLAAHFWPGPLTLIIPASPMVCDQVHAGTRTVGVRVPDHLVARALARGAAMAITATSANLSGGVAPSTPDEVGAVLGDIVDVLIDAGPSPGGPPSTIVDVTGEVPRLVRAGAVPWERVIKFLR